ncbi:hypothetical protein CFB39_33840 [Burkholderia sp. AU6039]|nr:hypothetical protein CFB39_33840 [Burkholderia sp. AU6039]
MDGFEHFAHFYFDTYEKETPQEQAKVRSDLIEHEARGDWRSDIGAQAQLRVIEFLDAHPSLHAAVQGYLEAREKDDQTTVMTGDGNEMTRGEERARDAADVARGQLNNLTGNSIGAALQGLANEIWHDPAVALRYATPFVIASEMLVAHFEAREAGEEKARAIGADVEAGKLGALGERGLDLPGFQDYRDVEENDRALPDELGEGREQTQAPDDDGMVVTPDDAGVAPDYDGMVVTPNDAGIAPDYDGMVVTPDDAGIAPDYDGMVVTPDDAGIAPDYDGMVVTPDDAGIAPADDGMVVTPDDAGVAPDDAGVAPDDARVSPDDARVSPDDAGATPDDAGMPGP